MPPINLVFQSLISLSISSVLLFGLPWYFVFRIAPKVSRPLSLLSVCGSYCFLMYLKPSSVPLIWIPILINLIFGTLYSYFRKPGKFFDLSCLLPAICILAYSFLLFFFRYEPPGSDPIKWGSLARIIYETQTIPGDTWPITQVRDLKGATLGLPILMAMSYLGKWVTLDRIINFYECSSLALFIFGLASSFQLFWKSKIRLWTAFLALVLFTMPQQYLSWGGTPTLVGFMAAFVGFELVSRFNKEKLSYFDIALYALALAFTAYAHPIGVYCAFCVFTPWLLALGSKNIFHNWKGISCLFFLSLLFFAPFLSTWGFEASPAELKIAKHWQQEMAPYLYIHSHSVLYNLYIQLSTYMWNTSFLFCVILFCVSCFFKPDKKYLMLFFGVVMSIGFLVLNSKTWVLPLSFLLYPERLGTLLVVPLSLSLGWLINYYFAHNWNQMTPKILSAITLFTAFTLGGIQFYKRAFPHLGHSQVTESDHLAMEFIESQLPTSAVFKIRMMSAGMWIPVLAYRATTPFHGLSMNSIEEENRNPRRADYEYFSNREDKSLERGKKLVYENGVLITQIVND